MRPSSAFSVYCKLCHVQAKFSVRREIEKVESFDMVGIVGSIFLIFFSWGLNKSPIIEV
jgi:hypothetical protein